MLGSSHEKERDEVHLGVAGFARIQQVSDYARTVPHDESVGPSGISEAGWAANKESIAAI
jgi:hypothetical protein